MKNLEDFSASWIQETVFTVRRKVDEKTGTLLLEAWFNDNGELHSPEDHFPAYREFDQKTGRLRLERWFSCGVEGRWPLDEPSEIIWDPILNVIIQKTFRKFGLIHRDHYRAAKIMYDKTSGIRCRDEFWQNGKLHREGGMPAIVEYDHRGVEVTKQEFYFLGQKRSASSLTL